MSDFFQSWRQWTLADFSPQELPWLWDVFLVILLTLIANYVARIILNRIEKKLEQTENLWDDAIFAAVKTPLACYIWLMGLSLVLEILQAKSDAYLFSIFDPVRQVLVIVLLTWFLVRLVANIENQMRQRKGEERVDETTILAIGKLVRTAIFITAGLVILQTLGYSIQGVLAFGGIGGIAVGFAAKDLLANFFGGLFIYLDRPFAVGEWVRSPDQEIEGTVEHIGWRQTRIRTFDMRPLYVPNATFTQISVENPSRMTNRRIYEKVGVRYDDAAVLAKIIADVKAMLQQHPDIDDRKTLIVNFDRFADSALEFFIYTFTKTTNWVEYHRVKQDVLLQVLEIVHGYEADVAYPTSTLHIPEPVQLSGLTAQDSSSGEGG